MDRSPLAISDAVAATEPFAPAPAATLPPPAVHLYQIAYSPATLAAIEPGFMPLDNLANPRPDWYEYWPIRRFLLDETLDPQAYYGFFSPKFGHKAQLSAEAVRSLVQDSGADVVLFSPQPDMAAFFFNVFEQGETFDPGLIDAYEAFLHHIGRAVALRPLVMDSRQIVFSNYFVARPAFWREWLVLNEELFAICEGPDSALRQALIATTTYPGAAQRKVFLVERAASLLLTLQPHWRTLAANPYTMGWSMSRFREFPLEAVMSDALKLAFREQGFPNYMRAYAALRDRVCGSP